MDIPELPITPHLEDIYKSVLRRPVTILTATPGSGKTLLVAPYLVKNSDLRMAMLQPRRVAARLSAQSMVLWNQWRLGEEVGLIMRNTHIKSDRTRLTLMTEGVLSRMLANGDVEKHFDLIILDEFHERSVHTDLACAWAKTHPSIKLLIMSATLDTKPLLNFFPEAHWLEVQGRSYPIAEHHLNQSLNFHDRHQMDQVLVKTCVKALEENQQGHILVFLPGRGEIQRAKESLQSEGILQRFDVEVHGLFSKASEKEQRQALAQEGKRRIILSTNIAETSLTIPNVRTVIDSGLHREASHNPKSGVDTLALRRIALDSAIQRAGRAGRLGPGTCYKLWTKADEARFRPTTPAEIHRTDPVDVILQVLSFHGSLTDFDFFEAPDAENLQLALQRLEATGCLEKNQLTPLGAWVASFPGHMSEALLVASSWEQDHFKESLLTVILLQEGDPAPFLSEQEKQTDDLSLRLDWLKNQKNHPYHKRSQDLKKRLSLPPEPFRLQSFEESLVYAFVHRLCRFREGKKKTALMTTGRGIKIGKKVSLKKLEFFIALDVMDRQLHGVSESEAHFCCSISKKAVLKVYGDQVYQKTSIEKAKKKEKPRATVTKCLWSLPLDTPQGAPLEKEHMVDYVKSQLGEDWKKFFKDYPESLSFLERFFFCRESINEEGWPHLMADEWELVVDAAYSDTELFDLEDEKWLEAIQLLFTPAQLEFIKSFAPLSIATPTRKQNRIDYSDPRNPKVSLILQEAFPIKESPKIGHGEVVLCLELLAPSRRPIEETKNMAQFWVSSYPEIRKQYRGRYPKHAWPESIE